MFDPPKTYTEEEKKEMDSVADAIIKLRESRYINEKRFGNISSFNFTPSAFYDRVWNTQTTKARGLYINIPKQKVVARAYDKFFNVNERDETKFDNLQHKLAFPVTAYVKENGFLGIVSYNEESDDLFVTTKSNPDGQYSTWFKEILYSKVGDAGVEFMKYVTKSANVSLVFECVDMENDPHVIEYNESTVFLLDVVQNDLKYIKAPYSRVVDLAQRLNVPCKEQAFVIDNWSDFFDWYYQVLDPDYKYNGRRIEGFVLEDANGFMVKLKLAYYNLWKFMRSIAHETLRKGYIDGRRTSALTTALMNQFYGWCRQLHDADNVDLIPKDICTLRNMFFRSEQGRAFAQEEQNT